MCLGSSGTNHLGEVGSNALSRRSHREWLLRPNYDIAFCGCEFSEGRAILARIPSQGWKGIEGQ